MVIRDEANDLSTETNLNIWENYIASAPIGKLHQISKKREEFSETDNEGKATGNSSGSGARFAVLWLYVQDSTVFTRLEAACSVLLLYFHGEYYLPTVGTQR